MSLDKAALVAALCPPLDKVLIEGLVAEFISQERRYVLADWEPSTLDGGQFAEIAARVVYHVDSGNLNRTKTLDDCLGYVEDQKTSNKHAFAPRRTALHLCKVLRTIYKFRSQRGAVHIDPSYTANELDSTMVIGNVRWVMAEILRVFWTGNVADVVRAIKEIVRYQVPAVLALDGRHFVLRTDCTVDEEILILLHNAGEAGLSRTILGKSVPHSAPAVTMAIGRLVSKHQRQVIKRADGQYVLTPLGSKRVHDELGGKLHIA